MKRWTNEEKEFLSQHYPKRGRKWVAEELNRSIKPVGSMAYYLKIKREKPWDNLIMSDIQKKLIAWSIAWEGSIGLHRDKQRADSQKFYLKPQIAVYNTDYELIKKFRDLVGLGFLYRHKANLPSGKNVWIWICQGIRRCRILLENIYPELPSKRKQAELLLEFCKMREKFMADGYQHRALEIHRAICDLNAKGIH